MAPCNQEFPKAQVATETSWKEEEEEDEDEEEAVTHVHNYKFPVRMMKEPTHVAICSPVFSPCMYCNHAAVKVQSNAQPSISGQTTMGGFLGKTDRATRH